MGYFNTQIITKDGLAMMSRGIAGQSQILFTKMVTGAGEYSVKEIADLRDTKSLKNEKQSFLISSIKTDEETIRIKATITNKDLNESYYIREIGVFAKENDGEEKLVAISICQNNPTLLEKFDTMPIEIPITNYIAHSGDGNFNIVYSSNVYATAEELHESEEIVKQEIDELDSKKIDRDEISSWAKQSEKPVYTKEEIGLGNVENTADLDKPVSNSTQEALDEVAASANQFTLNKIAELINGAPETLDTLKEVADAITENKTIVDALDAAIGTKANSSDLTSHTTNKSNPHGVTKAQLGLGNVENKTSATIRSELTQANVTTALGYTPPMANTWRGIQNNLTSTSTTDSLSAAQGKILKDLIGDSPTNAADALQIATDNEAWIAEKSSWVLVGSVVGIGSQINLEQILSNRPRTTEFNIICTAVQSSGRYYVYEFTLSVAAYNGFAGSGATTSLLQGYATGSYQGICELRIVKPYIYIDSLTVGNTAYSGTQAALKVYAK